MKRYLLLGQTGVGKSSFINAVFGEHIAETSEYEACTKIVSHYAYSTGIGDAILIDTPGLGEDSKELDKKYLKMIKKYIKNKDIHRTLYISPLNDTRFRPQEKQTIKLITSELGYWVWEKNWLILTFGSKISPDRLDEVAKNRTQQIGNYIYNLHWDKLKYFKGFDEICLIDNIINGWTKDAKPVNEMF